MKIAKIGGPTYKIGMNGGSASSRVSKQSNQFLDENAVQRGDPEVEQRMNRFVRSCIELGNENPILSIHDQGAGGNGNVLKEIIENFGCNINLNKLTIGDSSMNYLELWLAEYQESNALLFDVKDTSLMKRIAKRENIHLDILGDVLPEKAGINIYSGAKIIVNNYDYPNNFDLYSGTCNTKIFKNFN